MTNNVTGKFNNVYGGEILFQKRMNMARKLHSKNTKRIVFSKQRTTHIKGIRLDRNNRKIEFTKYGDETHWMGWNIHHIDFNRRNNSIDNFEAINYKTHKELHDNK